MSSSRTAGTGTTETSLARNRALRESALSETRRNLILNAARSAFLELGLDRASLREIAKRAGYTPGAIYTYFSSLEDIYAALLEESLQRLQAAVDTAETTHGHAVNADAAGTGAAGNARAPAAAAAPDTSTTRLRATAHAFYAFYRDHPKDLDLGFYLFNGARPRGLTPELNRRLNSQLMNALEPIRRSLLHSGHSTDEATLITTGIFAHIVGTLMLANTGRIRLFRQDPDTLFNRYIDALECSEHFNALPR